LLIGFSFGATGSSCADDSDFLSALEVNNEQKAGEAREAQGDAGFVLVPLDSEMATFGFGDLVYGLTRRQARGRRVSGIPPSSQTVARERPYASYPREPLKITALSSCRGDERSSKFFCPGAPESKAHRWMGF
jgi:hypothetical protein